MNRALKIDRARRNALKAAGLILGAVVAAGVPHKQALAQSEPIRDLIRELLGELLPGRHSGPSGNPHPNGGGNCFARGTLIRTRDGYRPIEALTVGDKVAVRFGGFAPIKAIVSHTLNNNSGRWDGNQSNLPLLVRRGALAENSPNADLCVTALHLVYVDGFLIEIGNLINGTSIVLEPANGRDTLDFFTIEFDRHDILDVQGALFESLHRAGTERCAPLLRFDGGRSQLRSRMRSVASLVIDRRQPIDIIRDKVEERGLGFARAA